jgi:ElaB/YqjD/DUF883 family membrane-anchored ribosome-binding protein
MARRNVSREISGIGEQLTVLRQDLDAINEQVQALVQHQSDASHRLISNVSDNIQERSHKLIEGTQKQLSSTYGELEAVVRRNPFMAIAIAAGLGLIAGTLSRYK